MQEPGVSNRPIGCLIAGPDGAAALLAGTEELARQLSVAVHCLPVDPIRITDAPGPQRLIEDICAWLDSIHPQLITLDPRLASLAIGVAEASRCEVFVGRRPELGNGIVIATDLADARYPVLSAGRRFARWVNSPAIALHNATPLPFSAWRFTGGPVGSVSDRVAALAERRNLRVAARGFGLPAVLARNPSAVAAILGTARDAHADVIVVGAHARGSTSRLMLGHGVADQVVRLAPQSVLIVPIVAATA